MDKDDSFEGIKSLEKDDTVDGMAWAHRIHPNEDINWETAFDDFQKTYQDTEKKDESTGFMSQSTAMPSQGTGFTTKPKYC